MTSSILLNDEADQPAAPADRSASDATIRALVTRLSRPRPSGGTVIERAAILAEGSDSDAIIKWILSHSGRPEATTPPTPARGLHGSRASGGGGQQHPPRYVLPAGVLTERRGDLS
jgi:hypothetical protein